MFVYYFAHIDRPSDEVVSILLGLLDGLADSADIAYRSGESILLKAGPGGHVPAKKVLLESGAPFPTDAGVEIPISWTATGPSGLFPEMEAELIVAPIGPRITQIVLRGTYEPPLGALGLALNRLVLHRLAEATVKHFVDRIASAIVAWPHAAQSEEPAPSAIA